MKHLPICVAAIVLLAAHATAQAPIGPGAIKISKIQPAVTKTPDFQVTGTTAKRSKPGDWLEVEVEFENKADEIDELTFKYTIMVEKKLLDGEVTHVSIPKGRERYSIVYVAPRSLEKLTGGRPLSPGSIENVWVIASRQGQVLDQMAFKPSAIPNLPHLSGMVLNKNETPFAPLFFDRYEAIKTAK